MPRTAQGKAALLELIERIGFVQVDSIRTVERAHHMILFARQPNYRPERLSALLEQDRSLFENWTHDASIIPSRFYPYWHHRFARERDRLRNLFGFDYRIEIFVPAAKRRFGYYVFPILEGDRLIGRIDMQRNNDRDALFVRSLWWEDTRPASASRVRRLEAELERYRRFASVARIIFADGYLKPKP